MVQFQRFPVIDKLGIAHALIGGPVPARLPVTPVGGPIIFAELQGLLGHEVGVSLELGAAEHPRGVVLSQSAFYLSCVREKATGIPTGFRGSVGGASTAGEEKPGPCLAHPKSGREQRLTAVGHIPQTPRQPSKTEEVQPRLCVLPLQKTTS